MVETRKGCTMKHTRVEHLVLLHFQGRLPALHANIRLGWKGLSVTNILAYYGTAVKIFIFMRYSTFRVGF